MNIINTAIVRPGLAVNHAMNHMCRTFAMHTLGAVIFGFIYIATGSHANAFDTGAPYLESELSSSRSVHVDYPVQSSEKVFSRNAKVVNDAQLASMAALKRILLPIEERKTREQVMAERKRDMPDKITALRTKSTQGVYASDYVEFGIYDASTSLFEDFDYDGFYQTFSVTFDADVYGQFTGERAIVFADLYLRHDNGPWELYFTTDRFIIIDDISEDKFEVLTTLDVGYRTGHYDVLIDLYEVGYTDVVATISSEDVDDLYAMPLESSDRDEYIIVETHPPEVFISAGSFSISGLLILLCALGFRLKMR